MQPSRTRPLAAAPRLLLVATEDWFLCRRLPIARGALARGWEVLAATRVNRDGERITGAGLGLLPLGIRRTRLAPWHEIGSIRELRRLYARERPSVVHHLALKPMLYGTLAASLAGVPAAVNELSGMGYVFTSEEPRARILRPLLLAAMRVLLNRPSDRVLVQNSDDGAWLSAEMGLAPQRVLPLGGQPVDTARFRPLPEPPGGPVVAMVSRMLWDKGVAELVEAARTLGRRHPGLRVVLVGASDPENPASIPEPRLRAWQAEGVIEWWGRRERVEEVWARAHVAVLPSHREGLPVSLLEAGACGRPLVACAVPGSREVVRDGETGLLAEPRDPASLGRALERLLGSPDLRRRLGAGARELVVSRWSEQAVVGRVVDLYDNLAGRSGAAPRAPGP